MNKFLIKLFLAIQASDGAFRLHIFFVQQKKVSYFI